MRYILLLWLINPNHGPNHADGAIHSLLFRDKEVCEKQLKVIKTKVNINGICLNNVE